MKLLVPAEKTVMESGRFGSAPSKLFDSKSNIRTDELTKASDEPSKPLKELFTTFRVPS